MRLEIEREKKQARELDGCTFKPKLVARLGSGDNRLKSMPSEDIQEKVENVKKNAKKIP